MLKRIALSAFIAVALFGVNLPLPAAGVAPQPPGRVLINAPDPMTADLAAPALPAGAPAKLRATAVKGGALNHVSMLPAQAVLQLKQQGLRILDNQEGRWQIEAVVNGEARVLSVVDGILPSGKEVIGFGTAPAQPTASAGWFRALNVSATTTHILICSYAYMASANGDLGVHLCTVDATAISAILTIVGAAVGGLVGAFIGNAAGAAVGVAVGTALGILTIIFFWTHSDAWGNVDFVIPNWTLLPPYGGNVYWANVRIWDYMSDQCWIKDGGHWYHPRCSY